MAKSNGKKRQGKKRKNKKLMDNDLEGQKKLEKLVFGNKHGILDVIRESDGSKEPHDDTDVKIENVNEMVAPNRAPAWVDEEDTMLNIPGKLKKYALKSSEDCYQNLLHRTFQQTMGSHTWATKKKEFLKFEDNVDDIDETMRCGNTLLKKSSLPKGTLKIEKMEELNKETRSEGPYINVVEFHPSATVALVAGSAGIASIIQVDGITNSKLQTIKFHNFPIDCGRFTVDGEQFIVGSKRSRSFFYYDMMEGRSVQVPIHHAIGKIDMSRFSVSPDNKLIAVCGSFGAIHLLCAKTKEWICDLNMNEEVIDVCFFHGGSKMYSFGARGEIYEWDIPSRRCVRKMYDEGCVKGTRLALSSSEQLLATGSTSGIVSLYKLPVEKERVSPVKEIKNLVTPISDLAFNSSSEILALASNKKNNALRLVHFPTMTVFSNFPGFQNVGQPRVVNFSPQSGFFAVGNAQKCVHLYRLKYYANY